MGMLYCWVKNAQQEKQDSKEKITSMFHYFLALQNYVYKNAGKMDTYFVRWNVRKEKIDS
jgi:hypothetical protein